jgi:hypothetical protein
MYAKYGKYEQFTQRYLNGRTWFKVIELGPWTHFTADSAVTVQGVHTTVWAVQNGHTVAVKHTSRQINMW